MVGMKENDPEQFAQDLIARGAQLIPSQAPMFACSGFRLTMGTNDCLLQLHRQRPVMMVLGTEQTEAFQSEQIAVLSLSPQSIKDLAILLTEQVEIYESEWGAIETEYVRARRKAKK